MSSTGFLQEEHTKTPRSIPARKRKKSASTFPLRNVRFLWLTKEEVRSHLDLHLISNLAVIVLAYYSYGIGATRLKASRADEEAPADDAAHNAPERKRGRCTRPTARVCMRCSLAQLGSWRSPWSSAHPSAGAPLQFPNGARYLWAGAQSGRETHRGTVLTLCGTGGGFNGPSLLFADLSFWLPASNLAVAQLEFRRPRRPEATADAINAAETILSAGLGPLFIVGWSLGGAVAVEAAHHLRASRSVVGVALLNAQSAGTSGVSDIRAPLLYVAGALDELATHCAPNIMARAADPKRLLTIKGADHCLASQLHHHCGEPLDPTRHEALGAVLAFADECFSAHTVSGGGGHVPSPQGCWACAGR